MPDRYTRLVYAMKTDTFETVLRVRFNNTTRAFALELIKETLRFYDKKMVFFLNSHGLYNTQIDEELLKRLMNQARIFFL